MVNMNRIIKWAAAIVIILTISVGCNDEKDVNVIGTDARDRIEAENGKPYAVYNDATDTYWNEIWCYGTLTPGEYGPVMTNPKVYRFIKEVIDTEEESGGFVGCGKNTTTTHTTNIVLDLTYVPLDQYYAPTGTSKSPAKIILPPDTITPGPGSMGPM